MPTEQTDRKAYDSEETPKFPETKSEQPRKSSTAGTDQRGHEQDRNAGGKDHRRVDAGDARKHAR